MTAALVYLALVVITAAGMGFDVGRGESKAGPEVVVACAVFWPVVIVSLLGHRIGWLYENRRMRKVAR